ncbi:hypothetical protein [Marinagarivorans cellulosilyticus]|nr:hypothetical protein [Marinagarivorans cellulosilyticus]
MITHLSADMEITPKSTKHLGTAPYQLDWRANDNLPQAGSESL